MLEVRWIKVNVNYAAKGCLGDARSGRIFKGSRGEFIGGFTPIALQSPSLAACGCAS